MKMHLYRCIPCNRPLERTQASQRYIEDGTAYRAHDTHACPCGDWEQFCECEPVVA